VLSEVFGFDPSVDGWRLGDAARSAAWAYDIAPGAPGLSGAGTVHHIAWAMADGDAEAWQSAARRAGRASPIMDRTYFRSVYVREPSGVLFELATQGPGFAIDEPSEALGRELRLPAAHEPQRARLERSLRRLQVPA